MDHPESDDFARESRIQSLGTSESVLYELDRPGFDDFTRTGCEENVEHVFNVLGFSMITGTLKTCPTRNSQPRNGCRRRHWGIAVVRGAAVRRAYAPDSCGDSNCVGLTSEAPNQNRKRTTRPTSICSKGRCSAPLPAATATTAATMAFGRLAGVL